MSLRMWSGLAKAIVDRVVCNVPGDDGRLPSPSGMSCSELEVRSLDGWGMGRIFIGWLRARRRAE